MRDFFSGVSSRREVSIGLYLAIFVSVCIFLASEIGSHNSAQDNRDVMAAMQVSSQLTALMGMVSDAEASQRSYLLTDREAYLETYKQEVPKINPLVIQMRDNYIVLRDKSMLDDFSALAMIMREKMAEMELTLALALQDKKDLARELVLTGYGKERTDLLRLRAKALEIRQNEKIRNAHEQSLANQLKLRIVVGVVTVLNILLLFIFARWLRMQWHAQDRKHSELIEQQNALDLLVIERTRELEVLASYLQTVSEREKSSIARELHDELGALLTACKMDVSWVRQHLMPNQTLLGEKLDRAMNNLGLGVQAKRRVIENLVPSTLAAFGLTVALREYASSMQEACGWALELDLPNENITVSDDVSIALFRIAQEAINNIAKYADATTVWLRVKLAHDMISLEIQDDGKGFNIADIRTGSHGLAGMRQRMVGLRGALKYETEPGQGTLIRAVVPMKSVN